MDTAAIADGKLGGLRRSQSDLGLCQRPQPMCDDEEDGSRRFLRQEFEGSADDATCNARRNDSAYQLTGRSETNLGLIINPL